MSDEKRRGGPRHIEALLSRVEELEAERDAAVARAETAEHALDVSRAVRLNEARKVQGDLDAMCVLHDTQRRVYAARADALESAAADDFEIQWTALVESDPDTLSPGALALRARMLAFTRLDAVRALPERWRKQAGSWAPPEADTGERVLHFCADDLDEALGGGSA